MEDNLTLLATRLVDELNRSRKIITVAESCTGGWITKLITDIAGSSAVFEYGFITYSNQAKSDILGVQRATLTRYGAVSDETVTEMLGGALNKSNADWAIAVSGIAGPSGGSPDKPVGTVWIGWANRDTTVTRRHLFRGCRNEVRCQTCDVAIAGLLELMAN